MATRVHMETELSRLFPEGAAPTERLLLTELRTGPTGRLILMALEGGDADLLAGVSTQLAAWMRGKSRMFRCLDQPESYRLPTEFIETGQY